MNDNVIEFPKLEKKSKSLVVEMLQEAIKRNPDQIVILGWNSNEKGAFGFSKVESKDELIYMLSAFISEISGATKN